MISCLSVLMVSGIWL